MDRGILLRWVLCFAFLIQATATSARMLSSDDAGSAALSQSVAPPFAWTSVFGAVDADLADSHTVMQTALDTGASVAWDAALATYNLTSTVPVAHTAYVFFSSVSPKHESASAASRILENMHAAAVPVPAAWWLLISGLVGLVSVARRRAA